MTSTRLYTLRVTYRLPNGYARVRNVRNLTWHDVLALEAVLHNAPSTLNTHATSQTPAWQR